MKALLEMLKNLIHPSLMAERAYQLAECRKRINLRKVSDAYIGV